MTSSNVSNLPFQIGNISPETIDVKSAVSKSNGLFEKTLQVVAGNNVTSQVKTDTLPKASSSEKQIETVSTKQQNLAQENKVSDTTEVSVEDKTQVAEKIEEVTEEIKEVIVKELDVTEEDLEKAMETLGFVAIDLFNPQNLAELVSLLTDEEDSISLIMSEDFKSILDSVNDLTAELFKETGFTYQEAKEIVIEFDVNTPQVNLEEELSPELKENMDILIKDDIQVEVEEQAVVSVESKEVAKDAPKVQVVEEADTEVEAPILNQNIETETSEQKDDDGFTQSQASSNADSVKQQPKADSEQVFRPENVIINQPRTEIQFVPEQQVVTLPSGETVSAENIVEQLVEQARVINTTESTTMEMTLNPEGLGKIFLEVTQKGNEITAKIFTENDAVKNALETQMANLRLETNQGNTKVTSIEVSVGTHEFEKNLEENPQGDQRREEQTNQTQKKTRGINLNSLDDLSGLMSEEDLLIAQMMKDNGNTLDFQA